MESLANFLHIRVEECRFALIIFLNFPFAYFHRKIINITVKNIYSFIISIILCYFMYGWETLHLFFSSTSILKNKRKKS